MGSVVVLVADVIVSNFGVSMLTVDSVALCSDLDTVVVSELSLLDDLTSVESSLKNYFEETVEGDGTCTSFLGDNLLYFSNHDTHLWDVCDGILIYLGMTQEN